MRISRRVFGLVVLISLMVLGCGPSILKLVRISPATEGGNRQEKSGVIFEVTPVDPSAILDGKYPELTFSYKNPAEPYSSPVRYYLLGKNIQFKVSVTNNTGHVLRFAGTVIKVIDDANNMIDELDKTSLTATSPLAAAQITKLRYLDQNVEVLPDMAWTGYAAFGANPDSISPTFKLAIYELVTKTDEAGVPKEKSRFEFNFKKEVIEKKM